MIYMMRIYRTTQTTLRAAYERIQAAVSQDPDGRRAQEHRKRLPVTFSGQEEISMNSVQVGLVD